MSYELKSKVNYWFYTKNSDEKHGAEKIVINKGVNHFSNKQIEIMKKIHGFQMACIGKSITSFPTLKFSNVVTFKNVNIIESSVSEVVSEPPIEEPK